MTREFVLAVGFLTRFPTPRVDVPTERVGGSLVWYPLVGLLLGMGAVAGSAAFAAVDPWLAGVVYAVLLAGLSGALHLDGLGDTADAWVGGMGDRERTLSIMKDPACGPVAVVTLAATLMLKAAAAAVIWAAGGWTVLLVVPVIARLAAPLLFLTTDYVRPGGLGEALATHLPRERVIVAVVVAAIAASGFGAGSGLVAVVAGALVLWMLRAAFRARLGGITGDTVGAAIELVETAALLTLAILA